MGFHFLFSPQSLAHLIQPHAPLPVMHLITSPAQLLLYNCPLSGTILEI